MSTEEKYVTAAFLVLLAVALLYVVIYSFRMRRLTRDVAELERRDRARPPAGAADPDA